MEHPIPFDLTEPLRRQQVQAINADPDALTRQNLEAKHGQVWDTAQMREDFDVLFFMAPYVTVRRLSDGQKGSLTFSHDPRFYWGFVPA